MTVIDAHCHASPLWFEPVETLLFQMDRCGVHKAVLTQILGQFDNAYQEQCVARLPDRLAHVGAVQAAAADAVQKVTALTRRGMAGLRLRSDARSPGDDPLAIWRAAADGGLAISCGGPAASIVSGEFAAIVREFAAMPFVIEHLGGWTRPDCDHSPQVWQGILALADYPNVILKIPALGQLAPRAVGQPLPAHAPVLDAAKGAILIEALDAFGAERLMWGSDFPVVASREGYANALDWIRMLFAERSSEEREAIFGGTAERIFFARAA